MKTDFHFTGIMGSFVMNIHKRRMLSKTALPPKIGEAVFSCIADKPPAMQVSPE
jgi:hypothetical protein